jgi:hypothetical protein
MDNIETNETPVGSDGATSSPDNASLDTQTAETPNSVSDGSGADAGQAPAPWDNDPKFRGKSPEDIYQAYKSVESLNGQLSQKAEVANLLEARGYSPSQIKAQIEQMDYQAQQERYAQNPLAPLVDEVQQLKAYKAQQEQKEAQATVKAEIESFLKANPAYEAHKVKLSKLALTPGIGFDPATGAETPIAEIANDYFGQARAQGQQDAYKKIETKQNTQATSPSQAAPKGKLTLGDLAQLSSKEMEAFLP